MSTQSTQYNAIQGPYDELRKSTISILERVNIREKVLPLIQGRKDVKVLDLACGSGFYSRSFLDWGASKVLGVDISSAMLEEGRALSGPDVDYIEADCSKPTEYPGGPFDIVFAAWLLNYASNGKEMQDMYENISLNLKPGGHFIGVTPPPANDPAAQIELECQVRPLPTASGGLYSTVLNKVDEGVYFHLHSDTPAGDLDFECYHLRKDVWETAAEAAGFKHGVEWDQTKVPNDFMQDPGKYGEKSNGNASDAELKTYDHVPHYGLIKVRK